MERHIDKNVCSLELSMSYSVADIFFYWEVLGVNSLNSDCFLITPMASSSIYCHDSI